MRTALFEMRDISIHAPHEGERRVWLVGNSARDGISIHAPHEGERLARISKLEDKLNISIHAPHEGERQFWQRIKR